MPIGDLNLDQKFVAMIMKLQMEWYAIYKERDLKNAALNIIFDDVLLYGPTARQILAYFITVLDVLKHHRNTLKLKKCTRFKDRREFVGMDLASVETQPLNSQNEACTKARETKYISRSPHAHWDICILQPVIDPI